MIKKILKVVGVLVLIIVIALGAIWYFYLRPKPLPIAAEDRAQLTMMPLPAKAKLNGQRFEITADFAVAVSGPKDEVVQRAVERFTKKLSGMTALSFTEKPGASLSIKYDTASSPVQKEQENEAYELRITKDKIELTAASAYGILHGLESLLQLVKADQGKHYFQGIEIKDQPRYAWRGLMIDACRHWIPKEAILRNLEAMAAMKMNVLHWHLSEYQAIRVESKVFPKLQEQGSNGDYYSQEDIKEVIQYAGDRGIRIVPEFDLPGHSTGFLVGYPQLASAPGPYQLSTAFGILTPVMDPSNEKVYDFLDKFMGEMADLFPDAYMHIGGDEVNPNDWNNNSVIQAFMKEKGLKTPHDLQAYFNLRLEKILNKHGKKMMGWDEILHPELSKEIIVQCWRSHKSLYNAVQKGSMAILSNGYYLDLKLSAGKHYSVDPEVLAGAVTIQPDLLHWKQYDLALTVSGNTMNTGLILYGEQDNLRGVFSLMDNYTSFEKAELNNNVLTFSFQSEYGQINVNGVVVGDSLHGEMGLGILSFPFKGKLVGSQERAGTRPPKVEQVKPLTDKEKKMILGGEAAVWTETISQLNIDSRIWPRAAAIAEKLWSPREMTSDEEDMYRRLEPTAMYLSGLGVRNLTGPKEMIHDLAAGKEEESIATLVDVLEEVKYYERILTITSNQLPLTGVADAAAPESLTARKFNKMMEAFVADKSHRQNGEELRKLLITWRNNQEAFRATAQGNERLAKVEVLSEDLSALSNDALQLMDYLQNKRKLEEADVKAWQKILDKAATPQAGCLLAVLPGFRTLFTAFPNK